MGKFNRVNGTVGSIPVIFHYFQDSGTTKSIEDLGGFVADPLLGKMEAMAKEFTHPHW